ncbi:MAG: putative ABC transport system permease protein [Planctomycetota bacterium]
MKRPARISVGRAVLGEALGSLLTNPLRSVLTMSSVAFGMAVLFVMLSYSTGVPEATASILRSMGSKEMTVEPRRSRGSGGGNRGGRAIRIRYADLPQIREAAPSLSGIAPTYSPGRGGPVYAADRSWPWARISGVGYEYAKVTDLSIVEGRWFSKEEEVLGSEVALISLPLAEGLFEEREAIGESIDVRLQRFKIIGVYESSASFAYSIFVPYPTAMEMGDSGGRYVSSIAFAPRQPDQARAAVAEIRNALGTLYAFDPNDPAALDVKENLAFAEKVEATSFALQLLVLTIAGIALVLGCLGAANVVGIAVSERTAELGLRRAIGAPATQLRFEVLTETMLLAIIGGVCGVLLGWLAIQGLGPLEFTPEARLVPKPNRELLLIAFPVLVFTATLAGLPAASRASRIEPAEALRSE